MSPGQGALVALFAGAAVLTIAVVALNLIGNDETADLASPSPTVSDGPSETPVPRTPPPPQPNDSDAASIPASFPPLASAGPNPTPPPGADPWMLNAEHHRGQDGEVFSYDCPANGHTAAMAIEPTPVWGTDVYSDDSYVCIAAVHDGQISVGSGGTVSIEMLTGQNSYPGTERNGILTQDWLRPWYSSYQFVP